MIPYEDVDRALNGHGAKFASLGLLKPIIRDGVAYIDERQWEALCARIVARRATARIRLGGVARAPLDAASGALPARSGATGQLGPERIAPLW